MTSTQQKADLFFKYFPSTGLKMVDIYWVDNDEKKVKVITPSGIKHAFIFENGIWRPEATEIISCIDDFHR